MISQPFIWSITARVPGQQSADEMRSNETRNGVSDTSELAINSPILYPVKYDFRKNAYCSFFLCFGLVTGGFKLERTTSGQHLY